MLEHLRDFQTTNLLDVLNCDTLSVIDFEF